MACQIRERKFLESLRNPVSYKDQRIEALFYYKLVKEPDITLVGGKLYKLLNHGLKLELYDTVYIEWYSGYKVAHGWRELEQLDTPIDQRHTNVALGYRQQKCRLAYSSSYSLYPRGARNHKSEEDWSRQIAANFKAFIKAIDLYKCYIILKIFTPSTDYKKIIGENHKGNYLEKLITEHEAKIHDEVAFYTYHKSLQERYNNAKNAPANRKTHFDLPICIKEDGSCCTSPGECERFKYTEDPNKMILECIHAIVYSNKIPNITASTKKFLDPICEDADKKWIGLIDKIKEVTKRAVTELTTEFNLAHNASDVSKCAEGLQDKCKNLDKYGVVFMNCCCSTTENNECFCELPRIRKASELTLIVHPMTVRQIDALSALVPEFKGYEFRSENFEGIQIVEDLCYPKNKVHLVESGFVELAERYNAENKGTFDTPDKLHNRTRHIEQEIITRFNKICCHFELPT